MPLTDAAVRAAKPTGKRYKLSDGGGLQLHVTDTGSKLWRLAYRFGGKQKELALGPYPAVSLSDARLARENAKKQLREGTDPGLTKRLEKITARSYGNTFKDIADEVQAKMRNEGKADATLAKVRWMLDTLTYPYIGDRVISDIKTPEVLDLLKRIEKQGMYDSAVRTRRYIGMVFRYAVATGRAEYDITHNLRGALVTPRHTHRAAILDTQGLAGLLKALDGYQGHAATKYALNIMPYVFVRPKELRHVLWDEIDFDAGLWRIPAHKIKMKRDHIIPMVPQIVAAFKALKTVTGYSQLAFPSSWDPKRPISENTLNMALRRLGYEKNEMSAHGFRRTASTMLNEAGFNRDWIERQLAHANGDAIRGAYNAAEYMDGRKEMMLWWANRLDELRGKPMTLHI